MTEHDKKWHLQYIKLVEFKEKNGHCKMPVRYEQDKALGKWVSTQRTFHNKHTFLQKNTSQFDRKELLDEIGFVWRLDIPVIWQSDYADARASGYYKKWHQQYTKLVEFKRDNGHCRVPKVYKQGKSLGKWVSKQRGFHKQNKISLDRKDLLDEIGFDWRVDIAVSQAASIKARVSGDDKKWYQQYAKLVEFKRKNGDSIVPQGYEQDKSLGNWVKMQRTLRRINQLRQDRKDKLDELDFIWKVAATAARSSTKDNDSGLDSDSDPESLTSGVGLPNEARGETELAQGHVRNRFESASLATNSHYGDDTSPSLVTTNGTRISSELSDQEVVQGEPTPDGIPSGSIRAKLEPSPASRKRIRTCLTESGEMAARAYHKRDNDAGSYTARHKDDGHNEEDASQSLVTKSIEVLGSDPSDQEVLVQEEPTSHDIPAGWIRTKLEPDW